MWDNGRRVLKYALGCFEVLLCRSFMIKQRHSSTSKHSGAYFRTRPIALLCRPNLNSLRSPWLGSGMNVETSIALATRQIPRSPHIRPSIVSATALNSSAGTSSEPVALRLAVWRTARTSNLSTKWWRLLLLCNKSSSEDEIANVNFLRRIRTGTSKYRKTKATSFNKLDDS